MPIVVYMVISLTYISFSDRWLATVVSDEDTYVRLQTYKGWVFVLATALLLYVMISRMVRSLTEEIENNYNQKQKLEAVLRGMGEGVFVTDKNGRIVMVNSEMEKLFGYREDELVGRVYNEKLRFVSEKTGNKIFDISSTRFGKGMVKKSDEPALLIRKDGKKVPVDGVEAPYVDSACNILGGVGIFRDVTEERSLSKLKSDFVSLAGHQLRSPLTGIKWFVELLLEGKKVIPLDEMVDYIGKIGKSNQRLIELVNDLLSVNRIESSKLSELARGKSVSLKHLIAESVLETSMLMTEKRIKIGGVEDIDDKLRIMGDETQLIQAFMNVINNAVKYSPEGGEVEIVVRRKRNKVTVIVSDCGVGIPKRQIKKVFEKFYRADNVVKSTSGSGLGLYVVKSIVEAHKGAVRIESVEGEGTKVYVELPIMYNKK